MRANDRPHARSLGVRHLGDDAACAIGQCLLRNTHLVLLGYGFHEGWPIICCFLIASAASPKQASIGYRCGTSDASLLLNDVSCPKSHTSMQSTLSHRPQATQEPNYRPRGMRIRSRPSRQLFSKTTVVSWQGTTYSRDVVPFVL